MYDRFSMRVLAYEIDVLDLLPGTYPAVLQLFLGSREWAHCAHLRPCAVLSLDTGRGPQPLWLPSKCECENVPVLDPFLYRLSLLTCLAFSSSLLAFFRIHSVVHHISN